MGTLCFLASCVCSCPVTEAYLAVQFGRSKDAKGHVTTMHTFWEGGQPLPSGYWEGSMGCCNKCDYTDLT